MGKFCSNCGAELNEEQDVCLKCGKSLNKPATNVEDSEAKSKIVAGLLALFFGTLGVHNFYLGYTQKAVAQLVMTIVGYFLLIVIVGFILIAAVGIWAFVEAIMLFAGSIKTDASGKPLKS